MPEHIALLLGCGTVGREVAYLLTSDNTFQQILVADKDVDRARQVAAALDGKGTAVQAHVDDLTTVASLARRASVMLNATGPFSSNVTPLMQCALEANIPYADINDEASVLWDVFNSGELDKAARQRGIPLVVGLGTSPGLTNIWARYLADQLDRVETFHIAIAMDPRYRNPIVFQHRFSVHGGYALVFRHGDWQWVPAFSEEETVEFPAPVGPVRVHLAAHCEPVTLPRFFTDLQQVDMKAGFIDDAVNRLLHDVIRYGLTATDAIRVGSCEIVPAEFTAAFLSSPAADHLFQHQSLPSRIARQVQAKGQYDGRPCTLTLQVVMDTGARAIAMPLAVTARLLVQGQVPITGLLAPEALPARPFLDVLEHWGVQLHLRREESTNRFTIGSVP